MYDHIRFHTKKNYPRNLPPENAAIHIGMYWQQAAQAGLVNPVWQAAPEIAADLTAMIEGRFSGTQFLLKHMDDALMPDGFNPFGQSSTPYHYDDEEESYGVFMEDYVRTLDTPSLGGFYYVEGSPETYVKLASVSQMASEKWKSSLVM